jgi:hypothetical protein
MGRSGCTDRKVELLCQSFAQGRDYDIDVSQEPDFELIRDFAPFKELMKPKR